jgi:putative hydrolase of the HAD superfamily
VPPAIDKTAAPAFERLRESGVRLALVSNTMRTPGVVLRKILAAAGLLDFFAHTVFSDEIGIRKPDPQIFRQALIGVGGDPPTSVHVGDDGILDVEGGRAAGLRVVQVIERGGQSASQAPDRTITCLSELPAAIASLEAD